MSAVLDQTQTTSEPTPADDSLDAAYANLTTRIAEPERASATPTAEPVSESKADDERATETDTPTSGRERDTTGRFAREPAKAGGAGEDQAPEGGAEPAAAEGKTEPEPEQNWRAVAEKAQRDLAAAHGNVTNAARQAAEKARQEALEEATRNQRETIRQQLAEYEAAGHDVSQARQEWAKTWRAEDEGKQQEVQRTQRAGNMLNEVEVDAGQKLLTLYHHGAQVLAQDTGLPIETVRERWAEPDERERFQRAVMQSAMAERIPNGGFNKEALNDYMATQVSALKQVAGVRQSYEKQVADLTKQVAKLTQELNRDQTDSPALRPEAPSRGAAPKRKDPETLDEAYAELDRRLRTA